MNKTTPKPREKLQEKRKMYFKSGTCTMLFVDNMEEAWEKLLEMKIRNFVRKYGGNLKGKFIYTN